MARHLITSALPYINGVKHLGNLVGSMLPADAYARFLRLSGEEVLFICATDEHGTPAELAAAAAGCEVEEFCTRNHEIQARLCEGFELSFDHFGRTSHLANHQLTQHFAEQLLANGFLESRVTKQVYSLADGRFLPDRYVEGTSPNCGYENARGDQCENCTKTLDPAELIHPRSAISGSTDLELRDSAHMFLLQSKLADRLRAWIDDKGSQWPTVATSIARKWLDEGLQDRGITRDLKWGIPVPFEGFESKVFYVWFDAPIGYLSATVEWAQLAPEGETRSFESWWRTDQGAEDVIYTQFMAKDNIPFHTLSFPATIMGSGEPWKLVDQLKGFNWLNYYGDKFSTSQHRGVFMGDALELLPADTWRWYLLSNAPETSDTSFRWELFADSVNKDLVGTLGNFANRCVAQIDRHFDGVAPSAGEPGDVERSLVKRVRGLIEEYDAHFNALEFRKSAATLRAIWAEGNVYLEEREPWRAIKTDPVMAAMTMRVALGMVRLCGHLSTPFIPAAAQRLVNSLDGAEVLSGVGSELADSILEIQAGTPFDMGGLLFARVTEEQVADWVLRFGGAES